MDIQNEQTDKQKHAFHLNKHSINSRKSDQSIFSNPYTYLENPKNYININEKMSLESNVSEKLGLKQQSTDLFDHLVNEKSLHPIFKISNPMRASTQNPSTFRIQDQQFTNNGYSRMSNDQIIQNYNLPIKEQKLPITKQANIQQFHQELPQVKITCKCYKSKCLQLYCECFSKSILCNIECQCYQCRNNQDFRDKLDKARNSILQKDPLAFSNKLQIIGNIQIETNLANKKGCSCKKTLCSKKYCECFYSGVKCTYLCRCQNCLNGGQKFFKE